MKKLILIAGCAALAACSGGNEEADTADTETTATDTTADSTAAAPAEDSMAGTYEMTAADGSVMTTKIDAQGNYVNTVNGQRTAKGTAVLANGQTCFNSSEEGSAPDCWTYGEKAEDGSWTATNDDGETMTIRKTSETY